MADGSVQRAQDGQSHGFVIFDTRDRACVYLGFSTWRDAGRAAREALGLLVTALAASVPEPVKPVDLSRYLGRWYEIARYDSSFERDCEGVAAEYSLRQPPPVCAMLRLPALP